MSLQYVSKWRIAVKCEEWEGAVTTLYGTCIVSNSAVPSGRVEHKSGITPLNVSPLLNPTKFIFVKVFRPDPIWSPNVQVELLWWTATLSR